MHLEEEQIWTSMLKQCLRVVVDCDRARCDSEVLAEGGVRDMLMQTVRKLH